MMLKMMSSKGQYASLLTLLVGVIIGLVVLVPVVASAAATSPAAYNTVLTPIIYTNVNGTVNSTGANSYINGYVNTNVNVYNTTTSANFKGTVPSGYSVKLWINGVNKTTFVHGSASLTNYAISASTATVYKFTVQANNTAIKNVTYYLYLKPVNSASKQITTTGTLLQILPLLVVVGIVMLILFVFGIFKR